MLGSVALMGGVAFGQDERPAAEKPTAAQKRDANLEKQIDNRLDRDKVLKKHVIDAQVTDRNVTLVGMVTTDDEKTRAGRLARIKGVTAVDNQIAVEAGDHEPARGDGDTGTKPRIDPTPTEPVNPAPPPTGEPGVPPAPSPSPTDDRRGEPPLGPTPSPAPERGPAPRPAPDPNASAPGPVLD
jgi:hypothetical protein